jgi:hypothetical protein
MAYFGTVDFEGKTYTLTDMARASNYTHGEVRYYAPATLGGQKYIVRWETNRRWREARDAYEANPEENEPVYDELDACDWDAPLSVVPD